MKKSHNSGIVSDARLLFSVYVLLWWLIFLLEVPSRHLLWCSIAVPHAKMCFLTTVNVWLCWLIWLYSILLLTFSAGLANGQLWANAQGPRNQGPAAAKFAKKIWPPIFINMWNCNKFIFGNVGGEKRNEKTSLTHNSYVKPSVTQCAYRAFSKFWF